MDEHDVVATFGNVMVERDGTDALRVRVLEPIEASRRYSVAGWASVKENIQGPAIYDVLEKFLREQGHVNIEPNTALRLV